MYLEKELDLALSLARQGGVIALKEQANLVVTHKPDGHGPVSHADLAIDKLICDGIRHNFPGDTIISEETFNQDTPKDYSGRTWFIDPIDGTSSYIEGFDDFAIMIGLSINGIPNMGVVFEPSTKSMWYGIYNPGTQMGWAKKIKGDEAPKTLSLAQNRHPTQGITLALSRHHHSKRQQELIRIINPQRIVHKSSVGLKAMLILDGEADLYVTFSTRIKLWDTCAPTAIFYGANGLMQPLGGGSLNFLNSISHGHPIIVANFSPDAALLHKLVSLVV